MIQGQGFLAQLADREIFQMSGIPFVSIADHVDVGFHLKGRRVAGPPLA